MQITDPAPATLAAALRRLRDDSALRVELARRAQHAAEEFAVPALRLKLHDALRSCARGELK